MAQKDTPEWERAQNIIYSIYRKCLIIVIKSLTSLLLTFSYNCFVFHICCLL